MKTRTVNVYTFDELSPRAKDKAREWWRQSEAEEFGGDGDGELWESAETAARIIGIKFDYKTKLMGGGSRQEPDIRYSGFGSQGDGASFVGQYSYARGSSKAIREEFGTDGDVWAIADGLADIQKANGYKLTAKVSQSGHYCHKMTMSAEVFKGDVELDYGETAGTILDLMRDFAQWIYDGLEAEYRYRMDDVNVDESILANEYEFTVDGERA